MSLALITRILSGTMKRLTIPKKLEGSRKNRRRLIKRRTRNCLRGLGKEK
jgi:hypothetical protein